jgi:hypothetical protein
LWWIKTPGVNTSINKRKAIVNFRKTLFLKIGLFVLVLIVCVSFLCLCKKHQSASTSLAFDSIPSVKPLIPLVNEISGIAYSKRNAGYLWGIEDSGNPPQLYLIRNDGTVSKKIYLKGVTNRDWEDVALANGYIYIAETGDNLQVHNSYALYRFPEPSATMDTVTNIEAIQFTYPDGSHDAEAFLIDSATKHIYIVTKRDNPSKIYRLTYPYGAVNTVTLVGTLPYTGVVGAALSGNEIIIKTYTGLFYYKRKAGEDIGQCLKRSYTKLGYVVEPQGEAISFATNGSGFYTLSEKAFATEVNLFYYKRK